MGGGTNGASHNELVQRRSIKKPEEAPLTCFKHGQTVARAEGLGLLEADFPRNVDVKEVNLEAGKGVIPPFDTRVPSTPCATAAVTFLCLTISSPSGPNTAQVLYKRPSSSSGIDPESHERSKSGSFEWFSLFLDLRVCSHTYTSQQFKGEKNPPQRPQCVYKSRWRSHFTWSFATSVRYKGTASNRGRMLHKHAGSYLQPDKSRSPLQPQTASASTLRGSSQRMTRRSWFHKEN